MASLFNVKAKHPFTYADPYVELGPTLAYDEKASMDARRSVSDFVTTALKLSR